MYILNKDPNSAVDSAIRFAGFQYKIQGEVVFSTLNYKSFSLCILYHRLSHLGLKMRKQLTLILNISETDDFYQKHEKQF